MRPQIHTLFVLLVLAVSASTGSVAVSNLFEWQMTCHLHAFDASALVLNDTLRPEISAWGLHGPVEQGLPFSAWANVSDTESGVRNASVSLHGDNGQQSLYPLGFNGSLYTADIPGLAVNATYTLYVIAFDMANNTATSYPRTVDLRQRTTTTLDPSVTGPIVVGSSLALMAIVTVLAIVYDRRRTRQGSQ